MRVALLGKASELKGEAAEAWGVATHLSDDDAGAKMGHPVSVEAREIADEAGLRAALEGAALVIDAVVGTGFKPPLRGLAAVAQGLLAESEVPVVAVDLPSGWDADSMEEKAAGGVSRGCGGDIYCSEDGACVWASDGYDIWAGGGGRDWYAGGGDCVGERADVGREREEDC